MVTSSYYSRNWENIALLPSLEKDQWAKCGKQTAELVLPFISLYKPAQLPISYGLGAWNITQTSCALFQGSPHKCQDAAEIAKNVAELGFTYFQLRAGLTVNTTLELLQHFYLLYQAPPVKRIERLGSCISTSLYLLSLVKPLSLQWTIASLIFHACLSFYQSYQARTDEKTTLAIAKGLMGITRLYQAHQSYVLLKNIQALEQLIRRNQEMDEETDLLIQEDDKNNADSEVIEDPTHSEHKKSLQDTSDVEQIHPEKETLFKDHPLKNLVQKIEAKRVVLINPTSGEKQDFGAYFHGYGKGLVKGANLRFQHTVTKDGSHITELHFKITEIYKERVLKHLDVLHTGPGCGINKMRPGIFHIEDMGTLFVNPAKTHDLVKVSLEGEQDIESFHKFLKAFNLEEALTISTSQDLEKLKLNFLFKFFYPPMADKLKKEEQLFQLSPEDLKQKIVEIAPEMKNHFETYQIQETELLPGFVRYSIPIDKEVRALGGRALTAALFDKDDDSEPSDSFTADNLDLIANIVKHGMLSVEMRQVAGISKYGMGSYTGFEEGNASSVFTQMLWQEDIDKQKKLTKFGYRSDVRLYFSLKALNCGSYQYDNDFDGAKNIPEYLSRINIFDFTRFFPFDIEGNKKWHEVMIPDRILPEEIRAMNVTTPEMREQLIAHFRKHDIIQIDSKGKETIHGVPIEDFILVEKRISPKIVNNCSNV